MGKSIAFGEALLALIFNGTTIAGLAQNATSGPLTNLYAALHTADPGPNGNQQTNEAAYPGYARVATARSNIGWDITLNVAQPLNNIVFPAPNAVPSETELFWSIGTLESGTGMILYSGPLNAPINLVQGIAPILADTATSVEEE